MLPKELFYFKKSIRRSQSIYDVMPAFCPHKRIFLGENLNKKIIYKNYIILQ